MRPSPALHSLPQLLGRLFVVPLSLCPLKSPKKFARNHCNSIPAQPTLLSHVLFLEQPRPLQKKTHPEVVLCTRQNQTQPNLTQLAEKNLFDCIREEDLDTLRRYVERGGPVHVADTLGDTSLLVAASTGNPEVVKVGSLVWFRLIGSAGWLMGSFCPKSGEGCCSWFTFPCGGGTLSQRIFSKAGTEQRARRPREHEEHPKVHSNPHGNHYFYCLLLFFKFRT